jgi:hypothetical protein
VPCSTTGCSRSIFEADAWLHPRRHRPSPRRAIGEDVAAIEASRAGERDVGIHFGALRHAGEPGRRDADDAQRRAIEPDDATDGRGAGAKPPLPVAVTEHNHRLRAVMLALARREQTTSRRGQAKPGEEVAGDRGVDQRHHLAIDVQTADAQVVPKDVRERRGPAAVILDRRKGESKAQAGVIARQRRRNDDELIRIRHAHRPQEPVDNAEDRCIGADTERQRQRGRDDKAGRAAQVAKDGQQVANHPHQRMSDDPMADGPIRIRRCVIG